MIGENDKDKKGFSALSDLASEVSDINEPIKPEPKAEAKPSTPKQPPQPQRETTPSEPERKTTSSPPPVETVSSGKSGGGSGGKWILGIIGVIFVIWLINNAGQSNKKPSYTPQSSSQNYSSPQSTPAPAVQTPSTTQSAGLQYTKPSVGTNNVLSVPEISWCIREGIRIKAMRDVIDNNAGIDEFNQIVNDYNSRCGSYRYRQGSQSRAERDVEAYRSQIVSEAIREARQLGRSYQPSYFSTSPGASTSTAPATATAKPQNLSYEEQSKYDTAQRLRRLGYDVDWRTNSLTDMLDAESRIDTANRLARLGYKVDWRTSSLTDMLDAESRIDAANSLKRKGISVDWRNYSLTQLLNMEYGQN